MEVGCQLFFERHIVTRAIRARAHKWPQYNPYSIHRIIYLVLVQIHFMGVTVVTCKVLCTGRVL